MKKVLLASFLLGFGASVIAQNKMAMPSGSNNTPLLAPNVIKRSIDTQSNPSGNHANKTQAINIKPEKF